MYKLQKRNVLKKGKSFQAVYRSGKSYANKLSVLYVLPNDEGIRRIGFAAGKRLGGAVVRNRVKRLLREVYRINQAQIKKGFDLIFVGRQPMINAGYNQVERALLDLCRRARIMD